MATLFKEVNYNLTTLIQQIDLGVIGLPDIQRPFVWKDTKVRDLFDSMYKGYPVGYFLFWANNKTRFIVKIFSKKFSRNVVFNFLRQSKSFFIKGDYFFPEYHFSILKMKNFNSLNNKNKQKVIIFSNQIFRNTLLKKKNSKQIFSFQNFFLFSRFSPNQILDISFTQLNKIRRLINACIRFKCSKAIISFSWSRCLVFCKLLVKANKKIYNENKILEIIRIKDRLYLKLDFKNHHEYFSCNNIEKKTLKKKCSRVFL